MRGDLLTAANSLQILSAGINLERSSVRVVCRHEITQTGAGRVFGECDRLSIVVVVVRRVRVRVQGISVCFRPLQSHPWFLLNGIAVVVFKVFV